MIISVPSPKKKKKNGYGKNTERNSPEIKEKTKKKREGGWREKIFKYLRRRRKTARLPTLNACKRIWWFLNHKIAVTVIFLYNVRY